jgi:hypothetical protein
MVDITFTTNDQSDFVDKYQTEGTRAIPVPVQTLIDEGYLDEDYNIRDYYQALGNYRIDMNTAVRQTEAGAVQFLPVIYGQRIVGGTPIYITSTGANQDLWMVYSLADAYSPIEAIAGIYADNVVYNDLFFNSLITPYTALGDQATQPFTELQTADSTNNPKWTNEHLLLGTAAAAIKFEYDQDIFGGVPEMSFLIQGSKVLNFAILPTETRVYSTNPAHILFDMLTNDIYGKGLSIVDGVDINIDSFIAAAAYCDELIDRYDGDAIQHKRFECNIITKTERSLMDNIKAILATCRGRMPYINGQFFLIIDKHYTHSDYSLNDYNDTITDVTSNQLTVGDTTDLQVGRDVEISGLTVTAEDGVYTVASIDSATTFTVTDDLTDDAGTATITSGTYFDFNTDNILGGWNFKAGDISTRYNRVKATFPDEDNSYLTAYEVVESTAYRTADSGKLLQKAINYEGVTNKYRIRDMVNTVMKASRQQITASFLSTPEALKVKVGSIVTVTHSTPGWSNLKQFKIINMILQVDGNISVTVSEHERSVYDPELGDEYVTPSDTNLPDPYTIPAVTGLSLESDETVLTVSQDGSLVVNIKASWTASANIFVSGYEVDYKKSADTDDEWIHAASPSSVSIVETYIPNVVEATNYDVRIRAINSARIHSEWAEVTNHTVIGKTSNPNPPTNLATSVTDDGRLKLTWDDATDLDLASLIVWRSEDAVFSNAIVIARPRKGEEEYTDTTPNFGSYYYWLQSRDTTSHFSVKEPDNTTGVEGVLADLTIDSPLVLTSDETVLTTSQDGSLVVSLLVEWSTSNTYIDDFYVTYKKSADSIWNPAGYTGTETVTQMVIPNVEEGVDYDVRVYGVNTKGGYKGSYEALTAHTIIGKTSNPGTASALAATTTLEGRVDLTWTDSSDLDYQETLVYRQSTSTWVSEAAADLVGSSTTGTFTDAFDGAATNYYWVVVKDTTKHSSAVHPVSTGVTGSSVAITAAEANSVPWTGVTDTPYDTGVYDKVIFPSAAFPATVLITNSQAPTGWYLVAEATFKDNYDSFGFSGVIEWGGTDYRFDNQARLLISYVTGSHKYTMASSAFKSSSSQQTELSNLIKVFKEDSGTEFTYKIYITLIGYRSVRMNGQWFASGSLTRATTYLDDYQITSDSLGESYTPTGTEQTLIFNYEESAEVNTIDAGDGLAALDSAADTKLGTIDENADVSADNAKVTARVKFYLVNDGSSTPGTPTTGGSYTFPDGPAVAPTAPDAWSITPPATVGKLWESTGVFSRNGETGANTNTPAYYAPKSTHWNNADVTSPTIGAKMNYSAFNTPNDGEAYIHGIDNTGVAQDINPSIIINGVLTEITKGMVNPGVNTNGWVVYDTVGEIYFLAKPYGGETYSWQRYINGTTSDVTLDETFVVIGQCTMVATEDMGSINIDVRAASPKSMPEFGATLGATWGTDISEQPSDNQLLNNLLDPEVWVVGSIGDQGTWNDSGSDAENEIILDAGPYGSTEVIWHAIAEGVGTHDGGWEAKTFTAGYDHTKSYRFSVWAKRSHLTDGLTYFGCSKTSTFTLGDPGVEMTNPYFIQAQNLPVADKWYLLIGMLHGSGYLGSTTGVSGIYDPATGLSVHTGNEFKSEIGVTDQVHRAFLYGSSSAGNEQWLTRPRVDLLDGSEPSIVAMLNAATVGAQAGASGTLFDEGGANVSDTELLNENTTATDVGLSNVDNTSDATQQTATLTAATKSDVGLSNVDNTSDATQQTATLTAATKSDVGLSNVDNTSDATQQTATLTAATKSDVGLSNVDNTSDATQQTATLTAATKSDVGLSNVDNQSASTIQSNTTWLNSGIPGSSSAPVANATANTGALADLNEITTTEIAASTEDEILNSYNVLGSAVTVTVGTLGEYSTINEALAALTTQYPAYDSTSVRATINLLTGAEITQPTIVDGVDLSWITITSVDSSVVIDIVSWTGVTNSYDTNTYYPVFCAKNGGRFPIIDIYCDCTGLATSGVRILFYIRDALSQMQIEPGAGGFGTLGTGIKGVTISGGRLSAQKAKVTGFYTNLTAFNGAYADVRLAEFLESQYHSLHIYTGAVVNAERVVVDSTEAGNCVTVEAGAKVSLYYADLVSPASGYSCVVCDTATVSCGFCDSSGYSGGGYGYKVSGAGILQAPSATGTLSQTANTITSSGLIIQ